MNDEQYYEVCRGDSSAVLVPKGDLINIIRNGKPLPKWHGRLIDADELIKNWYDDYIKFMTREEIESMDGIIENAPTIIEADKGE